MKILHIATDDKFIDHAYTIFEMAFPKQNEVWILSISRSLKFVKLSADKVIRLSLLNRFLPKCSQENFKGYDLVIFHSFGEVISPEIFNIPKNIPTVWLGWGYDYYDLIGKPGDLLLPETKKFSDQSYKALLRSTIGKTLRIAFILAGISKSRKKAIERLSLFSPVLPNEYDMVLNSSNWKCFPEHARWNYGTMEDHLIKGFEAEQVDSNAILIGNSASLACNHKETFDFLVKAGVENRKVIAPLSYGDTVYGEKIAALGKKYFSSYFNPLKDFMPIQDYVATIKQCGYVIMNHKRQQAVGNIVIMLYLGARVFLREENPTFSFLKDLGVEISSVQELENDISLLDTPLSTEEKERNKLLVSDYWSRESGIARTKVLVDRALSITNKSHCIPRSNV